MVTGTHARLAAVLVQDDPWADAVALLAPLVRADVAVALEAGPQPMRRGGFGLLPPSALLASDEATLLDTLQRGGFTVWMHTFRPRGVAPLVLAFGTRRPAFSDEDQGVLASALPLLELKLLAVAAAASVDTERQQRGKLEARLVEIERQSTIGTVAAAVAHDLSAPISALLMEVGELRERIAYLGGLVGDGSPIVHSVLEDVRGLVDHCTDSTERARQLLIDFRLSAHPTPVGQRTPSAAVNVADALRACVRLVLPLARDKVRVDLVVEPDLPVIPGTRSRLEQALTNILVNAIHAAQVREGFVGLVEASVRRVGGEIVIEIVDNGAGIPPEVKARIFEPFFTTKPPEQGTGLGLPIARDAVEAHGGVLEIESERGRGALFRIRLPIAQVPARANPSQARRRVLVVDDDEGVSRALERILRSDYEVTLARSGEQALELLYRGHSYDALLIDIAMPGMDGPELYERIRARWPGLEQRIVFATGGAFTAASRAFLARVPNSRFEKPITREELRPIVMSVVGAA
jgi:signal transduction histidine kinase